MIEQIEQGSQEWLELRKGKVTASRVADILARTKTGVSASRGNYLIELAIQRVTGEIEESYTNAAMQWGKDHEATARALYEIDSNNFVDQVPFVDHPTIEWFGCSPDGLVGTDGLVEIKCPNSKTHWEYFKKNAPPNNYIIQMQAQMACTETKWCDFVSYDPRMPEKSQLLVVRIDRDDHFINHVMIPEITAFLEEVSIEVDIMRGIK